MFAQVKARSAHHTLSVLAFYPQFIHRVAEFLHKSSTGSRTASPGSAVLGAGMPQGIPGKRGDCYTFVSAVPVARCNAPVWMHKFHYMFGGIMVRRVILASGLAAASALAVPAAFATAPHPTAVHVQVDVNGTGVYYHD
jgi:hypothetical protein